MKVICIDADKNKNIPKDVKASVHLLEEGKAYTVTDSEGDGYNLKECPHPYYPRGKWAKRRFIPLSKINETELVEACNETLLA